MRPVFDKDADSVKIWLPKDEIWYNAFSGDPFIGKDDWIDFPVTMDTFGLFVRGGVIVPLYNFDETLRSTQDLKGKKFNLNCYLNIEGKAKGFLFLSDGESTAYERGEYTLHALEYDGKQVKFI